MAGVVDMKKVNAENFAASAKLFFVIVVFSSFAWFPACSSAPKQTGEVFASRNSAHDYLDWANQAANMGRFESALETVEEARRLAFSVDDPSLRIKTATSRGNFLFYLGRHEEAFSEWETASAEGDSSNEPALAALARIYSIRARIVLLAGEQGGTASVVEGLKTQLDREMAVVRSDDYSTAAAYVTLGLAERQLGRWSEAESAIRRAMNTFERDLRLEDTAYCWFLIASVRSLAGNSNAALEALRTAISFDRRAENGFGLATSWQAMGDVYQKAGRTEDARSAWRRAAEIYRAIGLNERALNLEGELPGGN